jgi:hypothetical protein
MSEPQHVEFNAQASCGHSQDYGADWVQYALNTEAPQVQGVDASRNPSFGGSDDSQRTALA